MIPQLLTAIVLSGLAGLEPPKKRVEPLTFAAPGKDWALAFELKGYSVDQNEVDRASGRRYVMGSSAKSGIALSFWIEKAERAGDSKVCRDVYWSKEKTRPEKLTHVRQFEFGDVAIVTYWMELDRFPMPQRSAHAYLAHEDRWIDVHVSIMSDDPKDDQKISDLLKTIHIVKSKAAGNAETNELFVKANALNRARKFDEAAKAYQTVLDLEKKKRTLEKDFWHVLIDNLGIAYGICGDLEKSKEVLEYGIKENPTYPLFHYNLACCFAEMNQLDEAIAALKQAYKYKANMIKGETLPDPRKDDSFKKYLKNKKFTDALREFEK